MAQRPPPRKWFASCTAHVEASGSAHNAREVCGSLWYHRMNDASRAKAVAKYEVPIERVEKNLRKVSCPACRGATARRGIACRLCRDAGKVSPSVARDWEREWARVHAGHRHGRSFHGVDHALPDRGLIPIFDKRSIGRAPAVYAELLERGELSPREASEAKANIQVARALWGMEPWPKALRARAAKTVSSSQPPPLGPKYYANDSSGRTVAGPFNEYWKAQEEANARGGYVAFRRVA